MKIGPFLLYSWTKLLGPDDESAIGGTEQATTALKILAEMNEAIALVMADEFGKEEGKNTQKNLYVMIDFIAHFVKIQAEDSQFFPDIAKLRLPDESVGRLAKSPIFRCTIISKFHNGPRYTFFIEFVLFIILGVIFTRTTFLMVTGSDFGAAEVFWVIISVLITIVLTVLELIQMFYSRSQEVINRQNFDSVGQHETFSIPEPNRVEAILSTHRSSRLFDRNTRNAWKVKQEQHSSGYSLLSYFSRYWRDSRSGSSAD